MKLISEFWKEEDAVGVVEVILILVVLIGLVLIFKKQLVSLVNSLMEKVTNQSNTALTVKGPIRNSKEKFRSRYGPICHLHICVSVYPLSDPRHLKFEKVKVKWKELYPMRETERQKRWAAGSITAYLCLVLILMLSLISGTIASVRNAHARVMTACAMEQGLYSLFAGYDRTLLGQYELFFYNGGDKSGVWKPETMSRKVAETAGEVLSPTASGMGILSGSLSGGQVTEVYLGGYRLATDEEGSVFSRQICEAMKASLGTYGIQQLSQKLRGEQETVKRQEDGQSGYEEEEVLKQYEESKQPEEGTEKTEGEGESGNGTPSEPDQKQPVPEDFVNPIEVIQKVMKMGILGLVLPEGQAAAVFVEPVQEGRRNVFHLFCAPC